MTQFFTARSIGKKLPGPVSDIADTSPSNGEDFPKGQTGHRTSTGLQLLQDTAYLKKETFTDHHYAIRIFSTTVLKSAIIFIDDDVKCASESVIFQKNS